MVQYTFWSVSPDHQIVMYSLISDDFFRGKTWWEIDTSFKWFYQHYAECPTSKLPQAMNWYFVITLYYCIMSAINLITTVKTLHFFSIFQHEIWKCVKKRQCNKWVKLYDPHFLWNIICPMIIAVRHWKAKGSDNHNVQSWL
jgi:hypothetical protein